MIVLTGFIGVKVPFFSGGAFCRGVFEDIVHLPVLDKGAAKVLGWDLGLPLHSNLQG